MGSKPHLLLLDDNALFCKSAGHALSERFHVLTAHSVQESKKIIENETIEFAVLDERLPDGSGLDVCETLLQTHPQTKVIYVTAFPSFDHAVKALKAGVHDYLSKPFELAALTHALEKLGAFCKLERVARREAWRAETDGQAVLVGSSPAMQRLRQLIDLAGSCDSAVLITGETGTGKTLVARAIHQASERKNGPFLPLNCAALPEHLIEAELFGWEKGAFTDAAQSREGLFEMAEGGTLLLDEIGELPMSLQAKILSVVEEKRFMRLGGRSRKSADVRILAATNVALEQAMSERRFRPDLYFRLNVVQIQLPPLRVRTEDLTSLCAHLQAKYGAKGVTLPLDPLEMQRLANYPWPGNVRELGNVIERACLLQQQPSSLLGVPTQPSVASPTAGETSFPTLKEMEERHIREALRRENGNIARSAIALGISLSTLKRRLHEDRQFNLSPLVNLNGPI